MKTVFTPVIRNGALTTKLFDFHNMDSILAGFFDDTTIKSPQTDLIENEKSHLINIASPGFNKSDFNIEIEGDQLEVSVESSTDEVIDDLNYIKRGISYSGFKKSSTAVPIAIKNGL